jgi:hypothetical protein
MSGTRGSDEAQALHSLSSAVPVPHNTQCAGRHARANREQRFKKAPVEFDNAAPFRDIQSPRKVSGVV